MTRERKMRNIEKEREKRCISVANVKNHKESERERETQKWRIELIPIDIESQKEERNEKRAMRTLKEF